MKKILAFGASNSRKSINQKFALWAATQLENCELNFIDLNDYEMPIYSVDREEENGISEEAILFLEIIEEMDGIIISFAEHNGSYSTAFKNVFDWASRVEGKVWRNKPMLLLATSPGARGAKTVLETAMTRFPHMGAQVIGGFSLPSFNQNYDEQKGILDTALSEAFEIELNKFKESI